MRESSQNREGYKDFEPINLIMIFLLFGSIILEITKICVCNERCSPLCPPLSYLTTSNYSLQSLLNSNLQNKRELELNFYSNTENPIFYIDLSHFSDKKIQFKVLLDSKAINIVLKKEESQIEKLKIEPDQQIYFPQADLLSNKYEINIKSTPDQSIISNPDGLVNVTCDKFQYEGNWAIVFSTDANHGSYTVTPQSYATFKFNGTKIHILAYMETKSCNANIYIDSKKVAEVSFKSQSQNKPGITFSSDELPFGEHTIKVEHNGGKGQSIVLISFLYDPLPQHDRQKFGFDEMEKTSGNWVQSNSNSAIFSSNTNGAIGTFKFFGTRFWLTGVNDNLHGKFSIKIDNKEPENIDKLVTNSGLAGFLNNYNPALLYQSDVLDLTDHVVQIIVGDREVSLVNFMFTTQPYNGVYASYKDLIKKGTWREDNGGFLSREKGAALSIYGFNNHFWIVGNSKRNEASMNVYYDDEIKDTIDTSNIKSLYSDNALLYESKNSFLGTYNFKIENNGDGTENNAQKYLHISYLYYMNDKTITINEEYETIDISRIEHDNTWSEDAKDNGITNLYCETKGSSISAQFSGDKFWISGSLGPNYGNIDIIIDGEKISSVSLYHEREENNITYYESPSLPFKYHTLTLSNPSSKGINFYQINYQHTPDDQTIIDNLDGLINITCDKFGYGANDGWHKCITGSYANKGSYSKKPGAKAWYTFNGSRVHVLAIRESGSGRVNIRLDGKLVANANLNVSKERAEIVYSSDELPFGEHLIEVENNVSVETQVVLRSFIIDPLPRRGGYKLGYKDHISKAGEWKYNETGTPTFSSSSPDASITFKFHGTRFWLTGERGLSIGKVNLKIDDKEPIVVDECVYRGNEYKDSSNGNKAVLYYQSEVYEMKDHTITISRNGQDISLVNILYSTQPYNGIVVSSEEMTLEGEWKEEKEGLISYSHNSKLITTKFLNELWIIGNKDLSKSDMIVSLNDNNIAKVNTNEVITECHNDVLFYYTNDLSYDTYEIKLIKDSSSESSSDLPLHISYLYYLNEKIKTIDTEHKTLNVSDATHDDSWYMKSINNDITNLCTDVKGAQITITITCSKFWISGSVGPNYGSIDIILDNEKLGSISLYNEREEHSSIFYQSSDDTEFGYHTLTLSNPSNKEIGIHQIHYYQSPDDQSIIDNLNGLINVTCDKLQYSTNTGWQKCVEIREADHGSYTFSKGAKAWYTFNGSKVYIYANREPNSANAIIRLDNKIAAYVDLHSNNHDVEIIFSSNDLQFGEHTIEIQHDGIQDKESMTLGSIFVDPLPRKQGGFKLGLNDAKEKTGKWTETNEKGTTVFSSSDSDASITFKFHGTRFWITGVRGSDTGTNIGKFDITIDDQPKFTIDEIVKSGGRRGFADGNKAVLLYQSNAIELKDHVVKIERNGHTISLVNFLYTNQPYNGMVVPYKEMKNDGKWTENQNGYISQEIGSSLAITEFFNHLWIIGNNELNTASMNLYFNDDKVANVNTNSSKTEYSTDVLLYESVGHPYGTYEIKIENNGDGTGSNSQTHLHISYLYYLNDKAITINEEYETIDISRIEHDNTWSEDAKDNGITNLYCETKGSSISAQFSGDKFWISGSLGPNYGNIDIIIDGEKISSVSLYHEREENNITYYESPSLPFKYHTLTLSNPSSKGINFYQINYQHTPDDQTIIDNLDGLINITCDKFGYGANDGWHKCITGSYANKGSYSKKPGAKAWYTFNGSRVHVLAIRESGSGRVNIRLDGKLVANANLNVSKERAEIVYSSDELPFGEHLIEVENNVSVETQVVLRSFIIDPLPRRGGYKLGYKDHISKAGEWKYNETGTPTFSSSSPDASITFKFHGTRFWLTGERGLSIGKVNLKIDDKEPIVVDECVYRGNEYKDSSNGNKAVLYYQSEVYEMKDHTITISRNGQDISLVNILYSTQPYNGIVVSSEEMTLEGEWKEEKEGLISYSHNSKLITTKFLNELWIIGNKDLSKSDMIVSLNDNNIAKVNTNEVITECHNDVLFYYTNDLSYDTYEIKLIKDSSSESSSDLPLHISYLYYLISDIIEVDQNSIKIDSTELINRTGKWNDKTLSGNINNLYTETKDSSVTIEFTGGKFWLVGSVGPSYGQIDIFIDGKKFDRISLYKEKNADNVVYYESSPIKFEEHILTLSNVENRPISIYCIFYDPITPTFEFTPSKSFSQSVAFSPSNDFSPSLPFIDPEENQPSCSISDKEGNRTLTGKRCDYDSTNDPSTIVGIARSNFTNITYDKNGGAIHIINSGFNCDRVEFRNCSSTTGGGGAIYIKNSKEQENNVTLSNLFFYECQAIYGGAIFIYFDSEKNSNSIVKCVFVGNCVPLSNPNSDVLFGGSSIFLSSLNTVIIKCRFIDGTSGPAVKVCDISSIKGKSRLFGYLSKKQPRMNDNLILVSQCSFEINEDSKSSINIDFPNEETEMKVDVTDCEFKGKLSKGSHYIDGRLHSNNANRFIMNSCKFEDESDLNVKFDLNDKKVPLVNKNSFNCSQVIIIVAAFIATVIFAILRLIKSRFQLIDQNEDLF